MNIGFIPDTHLTSTSDLTEELHSLKVKFSQEDVTHVIHLGDIVSDTSVETIQEYTEIISKFEEIFSEFQIYYTLGNHDANIVTADKFMSEFNQELNTVVCKNSDTAILVVNTGTQVYVGPDRTEASCGAIAEEGIQLIEDHLDMDTLHIASHYPLQYTPEFQTKDFFNIRPEYTFPVNKLELEKRLENFEGKLPDITLYSGHLHPSTNITVSTQPFNILLNTRKPIKQFDPDEFGMYEAIGDLSDFIVTI